MDVIKSEGFLTRLWKKRPTARINIYLSLAAVITLLPLIILSIFLLSHLESAQQNKTITRSEADAAFIARNINYRLQDMEGTLQLLSSIPELKRNDFKAFRNLVADALSRTDYHAVIVTMDGEKLLDTRIKADLVPYFSRMSTEFAGIINLEKKQASGFRYDTLTRSWIYYAGMLLPSHPAQSPNALLLVKTANNLGKILAPEILYNAWSVALLDGTSNVIASSGLDSVLTHSSTLDPVVMDAIVANDGTAIVDETVYIRKPVPNRNWHVLVWGPLYPTVNVVSQAFTYLALGGVTIIALTLISSFFAAKHLRRSIRALSRMAENVGDGKIVPPIETKIYELDHVARTLTTASYDRHLAQERSEVVLQELVHRSKNTIALLQAIMRQLSKETTTVDAYQKAVDQRLRGFAKSIAELAVVEWSGIALPKFIASHLEVFGDLAKRVEIDGPDAMISPTAAQNLGLVVHELMTNSIKHGALSKDVGTASIKWQITQTDSSDDEQRFNICWTDEGSGTSEANSVNGFGSTIIERHAEYAFSGVVKIDYSSGQFHWHLDCPAKNMLDSRPPISS